MTGPCVPPANGHQPSDPQTTTRAICEDLCRRYWHIFGVTAETMLTARDRWTVAARGEAMLRLRIFHGMSLQQIAEQFGMHHTGVMWAISARFGRPRGRDISARILTARRILTTNVRLSDPPELEHGRLPYPLNYFALHVPQPSPLGRIA